MKKKLSLWALAVATIIVAATPARAQEVKVFGVLDYAVRSTSESTSVVSGSWRQSRLGVMASEDLGGGLKAVVHLEGKLDASNGTLGSTSSTNTLFDRHSSVALTHAQYGTVKMGRFDISDASEIDSLAGNDNLGKFTNFLGVTEYGMYKAGSIGYATPKIGGVTVKVGQSYKTATEASVQSTSATYEIGKFSVGAGYEKKGDGDQKSTGAKYNFGWAQLGAAYMEEKPSAVAPVNKIKAVSASVPMGQGFALGGVYQTRDNGVGADVDVYTVAVSKDVSKRTRLALVYQDQTGKGPNDFVQAQVIHSF